jgi:translation initiation factor 5
MSIPYVVKTDGKTKLTPKLKNIDGSEDAFYRYKCRQLFLQVVGKGKMIKTVLLNVDDVAKDLQVPPPYFTAFLGYTLGSQSKYDSKKPDRERASLSGDIDSGEINKAVLRFIQEVVLCPVCHLPETTMQIDKKNADISVTCRGCGSRSKLDLHPKFQQYVLNHPITITTGTTNVENEIQKKREMATGGSSAAPAEKPSKSSSGKKKTTKADDDDEEWAVDVSEEAVLQRRKEALALSDKMAGLFTGGPDTKKDPIEELKQVIAKDANEVVAVSKQLQTKHGWDENTRLAAVIAAILNPEDPSGLKKHKALLLKLGPGTQLVLLQELEMVLANNDTQLKKTPHILKELYDEDLAEEEILLKWYTDSKNTAVKEAAQPLIKWLQEAEEDDSDDD